MSEGSFPQGRRLWPWPWPQSREGGTHDIHDAGSRWGAERSWRSPSLWELPRCSTQLNTGAGLWQSLRPWWHLLLCALPILWGPTSVTPLHSPGVSASEITHRVWIAQTTNASCGDRLLLALHPLNPSQSKSLSERPHDPAMWLTERHQL